MSTAIQERNRNGRLAGVMQQHSSMGRNGKESPSQLPPMCRHNNKHNNMLHRVSQKQLSKNTTRGNLDVNSWCRAGVSPHRCYAQQWHKPGMERGSEVPVCRGWGEVSPVLSCQGRQGGGEGKIFKGRSRCHHSRCQLPFCIETPIAQERSQI